MDKKPETEKEKLLKEASIGLREVKRLEYQLFKKIQECYILLMKGIYPDYKTPQELKDTKPQTVIGNQLKNVKLPEKA